MAVSLLILAALVLVAGGGYLLVGRRPAGDDVDRFNHAREITSAWSAHYDGAPVTEEPEATEGKPELQTAVHRV